MKKHPFVILAVAFLIELWGQSLITDDFESGGSNWVFTGEWGIDSTDFYFGKYSLADSPGKDYLSDCNSKAVWKDPLRLQAQKEAVISFFCRFETEKANDQAHFEISYNSGSSWTRIRSWSGTGNYWNEEKFIIQKNLDDIYLSFRFVFESDKANESSGINIDDLRINLSNSGPAVYHSGPEIYEGALGDYTGFAEIISGTVLNEVRADYYSDNGPLLSVQAENTGENGWKFIIPEQETGSIIYYRIYAADSDNVEGMTGFFAYIAGEYKKYDSGLFSYYKLIGNDQAMAVRISADETSVQQLSSVLIRTLYESVTSFKGININIRSDMNGQPGDLIAEPVYFEAWSTSQKPSEFSIIDLRSRNIRVKGDFWIGLTVDSGFVAVPEEAPYETGTTAYGRSVIGNISGSELVWEDDPDYNYHFRAVLGPLSGIDAHENVSVDNILYQNYPNPFNPFTEISYSLKSEGMVTLSVFNTKGELVSSLVNEKKTAGNYFARFNADGLNSGIYFYKLSVDGKFVDSKRMLMIK